MTKACRRLGAVMVCARVFAPLVLAPLLLATAARVEAFSTGITGLTTSPTGCNACHSGGMIPTVTLTGPAAVLPGSTNEYLLQIFDVGAQHQGGLDAGASAGSLAVGGANSAGTQLLNSEITHTMRKMSDGTSVKFSFLWTAPNSATTVTLRAWGNAVNANFNSTGDRAAFASLPVAVGPTPSPTITATVTPTPTITATPTPTLTPTASATPTPPMHDSVVLPVNPRNITVPARQPVEVTRRFKVKVRNADPIGSAPQSILLDMPGNDCPAGVTVGTPDFDVVMPGEQASTVLAPGRMKAATVSVTVQHAAFMTFNRRTPSRCTLTFMSSTPLVPGNSDPTLWNNTITVELNVIDVLDPEQTTMHESVMKSTLPRTITIPDDQPSMTKATAPRVFNGDIRPNDEVPGHQITLAIDSSACPWLTFGPIDIDSATAGDQDNVLLRGGQTAMAAVQVNAAALAVTPPRTSARRCVARRSSRRAARTPWTRNRRTTPPA